MAKKKVSPAPTTPQEMHPKTKPPTEEMENLKTLNNLLIKQTTEAREQIKQLRSQLDEVSQDQRLLSDLERTVSLLVNSSQLAKEMRAGEMLRNEADRTTKDRLREADERLRSVAAVMEKSEAEARDEISRLRADCASLAREKAGAENILRSLAAEKDLLLRSLEDSKRGLEHLKREKEAEVEAFNRISSERDQTLTDLEIQKGIARVLEVKVHELERILTEKEEALDSALMECQQLAEAQKQGEMAFKSLDSEKLSLERSLVDSSQLVENLKEEIKEAVRIKDAELEQLKTETSAMVSSVQQDKRDLSQENHKLQAELSSFREDFRVLKLVEGGLRSEVIELQERSSELQDELRELEAALDTQLEEKGNEIRNLEQLLAESSGDLVELARKLDETEGEKEAILRAKTAQDALVLELRQEATHARSTILALQDSCKEIAEESDKLRADRDTIQNSFDLQSKETKDLTLQVSELKKIKDGNEKEIGQLQMDFNRLAEDCEEKDRGLHMLMEEKATIQSRLLASEEELEDMGRSRKAAQMLSLSLLKSTSKMACDLEGKENGVEGGEIEMNGEDEELRSFVMELEAIKMGVRSRAGKVDDLEQQLKVLQESVLKARKKMGFWVWLSSVTTIIAGISVAYVAKAR